MAFMSTALAIQEDAKVHVDLADRIPKITLADLHSKCYPKPEVTDKIGQLKEKAAATSLLAHGCVCARHLCRRSARKSLHHFRLSTWLTFCPLGLRM